MSSVYVECRIGLMGVPKVLSVLIQSPMCYIQYGTHHIRHFIIPDDCIKLIDIALDQAKHEG